jgi:hypothetical protein
VSSKKVGVACCRRVAGGAPDDLYPDRDAPSLLAALRSEGDSAALVSWDDPSVLWERFTHVVISSTWDSVDRPSEYLGWAHHVDRLTRLVNPVALVDWNLDKVHQRELAAAGVPTIPTQWIAPGETWTPPTTAEFVVKPSVSAGGRSTVRYHPGDPASIDHLKRLHDDGQTVMVQPYFQSVDTRGEIDIVLFDGTFSHAVSKRPTLRLGQALVERPWERMAWDGLVVPSAAEREVAQAAVAVAYRRVGHYPVYARVDIIEGPDGTPTVLEMELIDPYLSLDMEQSAGSRLARTILAA